MKIENLLSEADQFAHILEIDGSIFLANNLADLTGFCVPRLRHRGGGTWQINYEIGVAVVPASGEFDPVFIERIDSGKYVCLPRVIKVENWRAQIVSNGRISEYLLSDMVNLIKRYTLPRKEALAVIETGEDFYIEKFRRVYGERFADWILNPLRNKP